MRDLLSPEQLVEFFRRHHTPVSLRRIVVEHTPDGGGRCPKCRMAVVGAGCFLLQAAEEALRPSP